MKQKKGRAKSGLLYFVSEPIERQRDALCVAASCSLVPSVRIFCIQRSKKSHNKINATCPEYQKSYSRSVLIPPRTNKKKIENISALLLLTVNSLGANNGHAHELYTPSKSIDVDYYLYTPSSDST